MNTGEINKTAVGSDIFAEFLETSIHLILYNRLLYPPGVFERRKKYNVPVQMCLHPDVNGYISKVIGGVKDMVARGDVSMVTMVVLDQAQNPLERFVFELGKPTENERDDQYMFRLEDALRAFLLKLSVADSLLKPLPEDCSWAVHVHTRESTADKFIQTQSVQVCTHKREYCRQVHSDTVCSDEKQTTLRNASLLPLKTADTALLKMQMFVEESSLKDQT
ncbi:mitotic spindle assembly checkpoint protein MAD2B-like isoform X2 [Dreissena polymorpha]|uniref:mitotic spindle assembly checkpoint protein MAD2B-like isoform X2 n=1 Tax=Dreissena polymorpha TaxID=45954 RepID=UPI002263B367|nr:mitotic spindle assembly checkpoint protein MAD2B-like isoform X2 [Dreissena polymorpha]